MPDIVLRIELMHTQPKVWRQVLVPQQINLRSLHEVIQAAMGWEDCHLFEFDCNGRYYGEPDEWAERPIAQARNAKLHAIIPRLPEGEFRYLYDFGDDWEHRIVVEQSGLPNSNPCPRLLAGEMACPPEDIGGIPGYEALKDAVEGRGDEHGEMLLEMLDGEFDPYTMDTQEIGFMLTPIQQHFRRGPKPGDRPMPPAALDMEASLREQGIHSIEELQRALDEEIARSKKKR
jgi:hypothetical protein